MKQLMVAMHVTEPVLRIGVIGAGSIAATHHLPILSVLENIRIAWIADINSPEKIAKMYGTIPIQIKKELKFNECDAVLLTTPIGVRAGYISHFGKQNIPIFCEKPFAPTTKKHEEWLKIGKKMSCNYMRTTYESIQQVKWAVENEPFGKLVSVQISEGGIVGKTGKEKDHYQMDPSMSGGGILIEKGCHTLSQLVHVLGEKWKTKKAHGKEMNGGLDVDIHAEYTTSWKRKIVPVTYDLSLIRPLTTGARFIFDDAVLQFDPTLPSAEVEITPLHSTTGKKINVQLKSSASGARTSHQAFYLRWKPFLESISAETKWDSARETSLATTRLITDTYNKSRRKSK